MNIDLLFIYSDGGARGNPGPAACGIVIMDSNRQTLFEFGERIGETTNNVAEYTGVIKALEFLINKKITPQKIQFYLDSKLVVQQLSGIFKIKNLRLYELFQKVKNLEKKVCDEIVYTHVPRDQNSRADAWVNRALNNY
jgi:ribonuclease HI